jgi:hypothetical protein
LPTTHYAAKVRSALLVRGIERALMARSRPNPWGRSEFGNLASADILRGARFEGARLDVRRKSLFGILKERARLWPRTISAEWQASTYWDYFAVWEEIELSF